MTLHPRTPLAIAAALVLAACGGGGGDSATDAPASAATAVAAAPVDSVANVAVDAPWTTDAAVAAAPAASAASDADATDAEALKAGSARAAAAPAAPAGVTAPGTPLNDAARMAAAQATATSATNLCNAARPFYWEVGSRDAKMASGSVNSSVVPGSYGSNTVLSIASASKWLYGTYVAQKQNGVLSDSDRKFLSMRSGYVSLDSCDRNGTVGNCEATGSNGAYTASADGKFDYNGGHFQKHATLVGLAGLSDAALAAEVKSKLGTDVALSYSQPQLAGGGVASPDAYARVLRKIIGGQLQMGALLGTGAVCTNPITCGKDKAIYAPMPPTESWHYSVAHWVEDDPVVGDGAFSSPGLFGFYPWIDKSKTYYGVLARMVPGGAMGSVYCGRLIRKAWLTGVAQ